MAKVSPCLVVKNVVLRDYKVFLYYDRERLEPIACDVQMSMDKHVIVLNYEAWINCIILHNHETLIKSIDHDELI